jgi:ABC-type branched-subunit amino acid transport system ATPase component
MNARIRIKNYRCFADSAPAELDLSEGTIALVGPNNSGKSTLLKLFYELRALFSSLSAPSTIQNWASKTHVGMNVAGVDDIQEIFHNGNTRPVTVEVDFPLATTAEISQLVMTTTRPQAGNWSGEVFVGPGHDRATSGISVGGAAGLLVPPRGEVVINWRPLEELARVVAGAVYIGAHRNAISEGSGQYYDLAIGSSFISAWNQWKTGPTRTQNEAILRAERDIASIFGFGSLQINASTVGVTSLQVIVDGRPYKLRELGAGLAQFIVIFGNLLIRKPTLLLIDEPELNLHPSLQVDFLLSIAALASSATLFATHSIGLARTTAQPIYSFQKHGDHSTVSKFEQTTQFAEFLGEMSFSSFKDLGHDTVLLVEGVNDVKTLQAFLRLYGRDHDVVVLPMGGDQFIGPGRTSELSELQRLTTNVGVLIDSERSGAGAPLARNRQEFVDDCSALHFNLCVTDRRAIENYLSQDSIQSEFGTSFTALGPFESITRRNPNWGKANSWRAARRMRLEDLTGTDIGGFLAALP